MNTLKKSFDILHSSFLFLILACVIHVLYVTSSLKYSFTIVIFILIGLKIYLFGGIYGTLVELCSLEQSVITLKSLQNNAKRYWKIYGLLAAAQFAATKLIYIFLGRINIFPNFVIFYFDLIILYILSKYIINDKYRVQRPILSGQPTVVSVREDCRNRKLSPILILFSLFILNAIVINFRHFIPIDQSLLTNEPVVIHTYLHLLTFIYLVQILIKSYPEIEKSFDHEKELYLVNPAIGGFITSMFHSWIRLYPPAFVVLKALTPKDYHVKEFFKIPWKNRFYKPNKLVAVTCHTSNCHEAYKIAKEFKKRGSKVVMGGCHVTYLPDEALQFCDSVVIGEAESVWPEIIKDYENNDLKNKYYGTPLDEAPPEIHQELMNSKPEVIKDFIETTRGCKYRCDFCTISSLSGGKVRKKPIREIVELIEKIRPKYKHILLMDNNIYSDPNYAKELFKALIPLKIKWESQCSIDIAKDQEALKLAKESGCINLLIGYEIFTGSKESDKKGKFNFSEKYSDLTKKIKKAGISIKAHFIFGFESDNWLSMLKMWKFCFLMKPAITVISLLTPLPGSNMFLQMQNENRITDYNWRNYDLQHQLFRHRNMNTSLINVAYQFFRYFAFLTTCDLGLFLLGIMIADGIFFEFRHFLF